MSDYKKKTETDLDNVIKLVADAPDKKQNSKQKKKNKILYTALTIAALIGVVVLATWYIAKLECTIKGNIDTKTGERIYYTVQDRGYKQVKIDLKKGEKWLCSVESAVEYGFIPKNDPLKRYQINKGE